MALAFHPFSNERDPEEIRFSWYFLGPVFSPLLSWFGTWTSCFTLTYWLVLLHKGLQIISEATTRVAGVSHLLSQLVYISRKVCHVRVPLPAPLELLGCQASASLGVIQREQMNHFHPKELCVSIRVKPQSLQRACFLLLNLLWAPTWTGWGCNFSPISFLPHATVFWRRPTKVYDIGQDTQLPPAILVVAAVTLLCVSSWEALPQTSATDWKRVRWVKTWVF